MPRPPDRPDRVPRANVGPIFGRHRYDERPQQATSLPREARSPDAADVREFLDCQPDARFRLPAVRLKYRTFITQESIMAGTEPVGQASFPFLIACVHR